MAKVEKYLNGRLQELTFYKYTNIAYNFSKQIQDYVLTLFKEARLNNYEQIKQMIECYINDNLKRVYRAKSNAYDFIITDDFMNVTYQKKYIIRIKL